MKKIKIRNIITSVALCAALLVGNIAASNVATIALAATKKISVTAISGIETKKYTGAQITQSPVIKDGTKTLKKGTDYTISYSDNYEVGIATVTIKGKNNYTGSVSKTFQIIPADVTTLKASTVVAGTAQLTWDFGREVWGYQVYYSSEKNGDYKKLATVDTNGYTAKLTGGKTYYLKVRAYAKSEDKTYYGAFTKALEVKINTAENKIKIHDSGKAYGNYIELSDIPKQIIKEMKYMYTNGVLLEFRIQYLDKNTNSGRWVDFFEEASADNDIPLQVEVTYTDNSGADLYFSVAKSYVLNRLPLDGYVSLDSQGEFGAIPMSEDVKKLLFDGMTDDYIISYTPEYSASTQDNDGNYVGGDCTWYEITSFDENGFDNSDTYSNYVYEFKNKSDADAFYKSELNGTAEMVVTQSGNAVGESSSDERSTEMYKKPGGKWSKLHCMYVYERGIVYGEHCMFDDYGDKYIYFSKPYTVEEDGASAAFLINYANIMQNLF